MPRLLKTLAAVVLAAGLTAFGYRAYLYHSHTGTVAAEDEPILIPGVQEPPEMRVAPIPFDVPTAPERMVGEAMKKTENAGSGALMPALSRVITKYPDYADAYVLRLASLCRGTDRAAILFDVNQFLRYSGNSRTGKDSINGIYSMRAKIEHANGDDVRAMDDLEKAVNSNVAEAYEFVNSGATAPEKTASACTWVGTRHERTRRKVPHRL